GDLEPVIRTVAVLFHDLAGSAPVLCDIAVVTRQALQYFRRHSPDPSGGGSIAPPISALPSLIVSINALRSRVSANARRISGSLKGGLSRLTIRLRLTLVGSARRLPAALGF